jgi:hypothetical protein
MFVLVQHTISEPAAFWNAADPNTISPQIKLHHTFPTPDGTRAVCIWEAASVDALRNILEPLIGGISRNEYFPVEHREGFARPSKVPQTATAGSTGR